MPAPRYVPLLWRLADRLRAAGYTSAALADQLGLRMPDDVGLLNHAPVLERLRGVRSRAAALTRLFFLEAPEPASRILDRRMRQALVDCGLLRKQLGTLHARLRLDPVGDQWFLADRRFRPPDPHALGLPAGDPVYPPSSDSLLLRDATVASESGAVLDLCTGSGIQAIAVASRAPRVIAVDVSPRAAAMARANAALNHVTNVDVRAGNLFAPVVGERFDAVVANPPFVPSPYRRGPAYHAGGPSGTRVLQRIIAGLAQVLNPGGRFFAVSHLALRGSEAEGTVAQSWFARFPGRALLLVLERGTAVDLAAAQALFALHDGLAAYGREVRRWATYLRRHRVREVLLVLVVAERSGRHESLTIVEAMQRSLPLPLSHPPRHHVEQWLRANTS